MDNSKLPAYPSPEFLGDSGLGLTKLERFTMAAMQGLCVTFGKKIALEDYAELLAIDAVDVAKATLSELSKYQ